MRRQGCVFRFVDTVPDAHPGGRDKSLGRRQFGRHEIVVALEAREANLVACRLALAQRELHQHRRAHLDRGAAGLAVALRKMRVADRKQRARDEHRQQKACARAQLLDVEIAAIFTWRNCAQPFRRDRLARGHRARRLGRQHKPAALAQVLFAPQHLAPQLFGRRDPDRPHERTVAHAHARKLGRGGPAAGDFPFHDVRVGKFVAQKSEARHLDRETPSGGLEFADIHFEQVARLRPFHEHWPGERVHHAHVDLEQIVRAARRGDLAVERVAGLEFDLLTRLGFQRGRDLAMPAVMALGRFRGASNAVVHLDAFHRICRLSRSAAL